MFSWSPRPATTGIASSSFPAAPPDTLSVGALAEDLHNRAGFSNYGSWVDVYAPGENLVNSYLNGTYTCTEPPHENEVRQFRGMARWSGTSFATPLVAGLIGGRMSTTGENAKEAGAALKAYAQTRSTPGVGRALLPDDACPSTEPDNCRPRHKHHC